MISPGEKAALTKRARYGDAGMSEIARRAVETRRAVLDDLDRAILRAARSAQSRGRRRGWDVDDNLSDWALGFAKAQNYRCALSDVPFSLEVLGSGQAPRPFAPSIDRISARGGYTIDNIRLVCWATNILLSTWGEPVARRIARGIIQKETR
ncbi:MAG: hypothetical protein AAFT19_08525 [Pseudomonadota bacterium]